MDKANIRLDALSADLAEKNKLVGKVSDLQRATTEVRDFSALMFADGC